MSQERLLCLVNALIDMVLDATDDAALVEGRIRALGFGDEELRLFGFEVDRK